MPIVDVYAPEGTFPESTHRELAVALTTAALKAEGFSEPSGRLLEVAGAFFHWLPAATIHTAGTEQAQIVRIQVTAAAGMFKGSDDFIPEVTKIVAELAGDPSLAQRTWIYVTEALPGGIGIGGVVAGAPR
jgi:phenylpyruvate tautomerase PptA (4-oxalocrotonate tautomerase family)